MTAHSPVWSRDPQKVIQQSFPLLGRHPGTPGDHFVDLTIPLRASEALLADHVLVVAEQTCSTEVRWGLDCRSWAGSTRLRLCGFPARVHIHTRDDVPEVAGGIPLLHQRLNIAACIARSRQDRV